MSFVALEKARSPYFCKLVGKARCTPLFYRQQYVARCGATNEPKGGVMNKTVLAIAAGLMASTSAAQAGGLLPRLQPVTVVVTGLTMPAASGLAGSVQPKEGEPRFGLPAFPALTLPELPDISVPVLPLGQYYWVHDWVDYTVNWYSRDAISWATRHAPVAAWDELDIVLGMAGAGDIGGASSRMASFSTKVPAPPQPQLPWELGLNPTYHATWDATVGAVFGPPHAH